MPELVTPVKKLWCWWFGCAPHPDDPAPLEHVHCAHCDEVIGYDEYVSRSRHDRLVEALRYWLYRRWIPERCGDCGKRWGQHDECLPF